MRKNSKKQLHEKITLSLNLEGSYGGTDMTTLAGQAEQGGREDGAGEGSRGRSCGASALPEGLGQWEAGQRHAPTHSP